MYQGGGLVGCTPTNRTPPRVIQALSKPSELACRGSLQIRRQGVAICPFLQKIRYEVTPITVPMACSGISAQRNSERGPAVAQSTTAAGLIPIGLLQLLNSNA